MSDIYRKIGDYIYLVNDSQTQITDKTLLRQKAKEFLPLVIKEHPGAFTHGCGRKTMVYYFQEVSAIYFPKNLLRSVIKENCKNSCQNVMGYWMFEF